MPNYTKRNEATSIDQLRRTDRCIVVGQMVAWLDDQGGKKTDLALAAEQFGYNLSLVEDAIGIIAMAAANLVRDMYSKQNE